MSSENTTTVSEAAGGVGGRNEKDDAEAAAGGNGTSADDTPKGPGLSDASSHSSEPAQPEVQPQSTVKATSRELTPHEQNIVNDPQLFREFCIVSQRGMLDNLKDVRLEQQAQKKREGQLAAYMAISMLDNAKLHEQFRNKSISRTVAAKMNALAAEAGVQPIDLAQFAEEHGGPEAGIVENEPVRPKHTGTSSGSATTKAEKRKAGNDEKNETVPKKPKHDGKDKPKVDPKASTEDVTSPDDDGIALPGGFFSRENDVVLLKWGFRGTGIKGQPGCIIRIPGEDELKLPSTVTQAAKAAAAEGGSKSDRSKFPKCFAATLAKYVETVLDHLVERKKEHAPFLFEPLLSLEAFREAVGKTGTITPRELNDAQASIWKQLLREAFSNMKLKGTEASISLQGLDGAIQLLQKKVDLMGKSKKVKKTAEVAKDKQQGEEESDMDDF